MTKTLIVPIEREVAILAGEINSNQKKVVKNWGMADSLILATARNGSAKVITSDGHFKGLPETQMV